MPAHAEPPDPATSAPVEPEPSDTASPAPSEEAAVPEDLDSDGDGTLDRPDTVSAVVTARAVDEPVEDLSRRTETMRVVVNPDGSISEEQHAAPTWVQDEEGAWVDVDYTLVPRSGGGYVPKAAPTDLVIDGGKKEFARLVLPDGSQTIWSWPDTLPEPVVEGPVATYAVAEEVDLVVIATAQGVSTRIHLNTPEAVAPEFRVLVRTVGAELEHTDDGQLVMADDAGEVIAATPMLVAWDGRLDEFGDPIEVVRVEASIEEVASKGDRTDHELTLAVPAELVEDPDVVFPIVIDPEMAPFAPVQDAWVRDGIDWVSELKYRLMVGASESHSNGNPSVTLVQWKTQPMRDRTISKAEVGFFQYMSGSCSPKRVNIHPVTSAWDEVVLWSNRPSMSSSTGTSTSFTKNIGASGCTPGGGFVTADVTAMVQAWGDGPDHGGFANFGMQLNIPTANAHDFSFERRLCSTDYDPTHAECDRASRTPYLKFTYTDNLRRGTAGSAPTNATQPPSADSSLWELASTHPR